MRIRPTTYILATVILLLLFAPAPVYALGMAKIVVKVADETGAPVAKANLNIRFSSNSGTVKGSTDEHGIFETTAFSNDGVVLGDITKEGYYESGIAHSFYVTKFGIWQPWGKVFKVVMRPIVNPVPMYVRNNFFKFPALDKEIGFDLEKADWVTPYGQGAHSDFIFKVERRYDNADNFDAKMTLTFSNPHDGIQVFKDDGGGDFNIGSWYRWPRIAPESGYQSKIQKRLSRGSYGRHSDSAEDNNFIFRVRSEVDKQGNFKRALYGKIKGDLKFDAFISPIRGKEGSGAIGMHYYLNPEYTRNLEFDPKRNLFVITNTGENVMAP